MRKINIKDLEINIDITHILNLYASENSIIIDVDGNIYTKLEKVEKKAIIYKSMDSRCRIWKDKKSFYKSLEFFCKDLYDL